MNFFAFHAPTKQQIIALFVAQEIAYLYMVWIAGDTSHFAMSLLFWFAAMTLLFERWDKLEFINSWIPFITGFLGLAATAVFVHHLSTSEGLLLGAKIWRGDAGPPEGRYMRAVPVLFFVSTVIMLSGIHRVQQYWREITILIFLGMPAAILSAIHIIPTIIGDLSAKLAAFLLWYIGFTVEVVGEQVILPGGGVLVGRGCAGMDNMTYMIGLAVLGSIMFNIKGWKLVLAPFIGAAVAFFVNALRVGTLALLSAFDQRELFESLHHGPTSYFWSVISVVLITGVYFAIVRLEKGSVSAGAADAKRSEAKQRAASG